MKKLLTVVSLTTLLLVPATTSSASPKACAKYHGMTYIICKESGPEHLPNGLPPGTPHPGPSSATGPCGFLAATRRQYGGDNLIKCERYMNKIYGTWEKAEQHHRAKNWW